MDKKESSQYMVVGVTQNTTQWSPPSYEFWGEECSMDGTDFDREKGKKIIIDALSATGGVKPQDPTFEDLMI